MTFTQVEKDRLTEVLFYLYFNNQDPERISSKSFWDAIGNICDLYGINRVHVSKAARMLFADDNKPSEIEMWFLLGKLGVSVRPINKMTGIYWQKQKHFEELVTKYGPPTIARRIPDVAVRNSLRSFIVALVEMFGTFSAIEGRYLNSFFNL